MSAATTDVLEKVFMTFYEKELTRYLAKESEVLPLLTHVKSFGGWDWRKTFKTTAVRGSTTFSSALANKNAATPVAANYTRSQDHVIVSVEREAIRASRGKEGAIVDALEDSMDSAYSEMALSLDSLLCGDGGGSRGVVGTVVGAVVTLSDPSTIWRFKEGDLICLSDDNGTSAAHVLRDAGATAEILSVNQEEGEFTLTTTLVAAIPSGVVGDYIFRDGDFDKGAKRILQGFFAAIPGTAPTAGDNFFGMDRSINVGALAGLRHDGGGASKIDTLRDVAALIRRNRGKGDMVLMNPEALGEIDQNVTANITFEEKTKYKDVGIEGIKVVTPNGILKAVGISAMPANKFLVTKQGSWKIRSLDGLPHMVDDDGKMWHLEQTADALQGRLCWFAQLGCMAPKNSCNGTW